MLPAFDRRPVREQVSRAAVARQALDRANLIQSKHHGMAGAASVGGSGPGQSVHKPGDQFGTD
jgi:hypothetical protein